MYMLNCRKTQNIANYDEEYETQKWENISWGMIRKSHGNGHQNQQEC